MSSPALNRYSHKEFSLRSSNTDKVTAVIAAIRAQDADRALQLVDPRFVQHSPAIGDGIEGLRRYILSSKPEELRLEIVRVLEDGAYVVVQLRSEGSGETIFAVYRFQNALLAEHWAFSSPAAPPNKSGHTQTDGPAAPQHLGETEKNKAFARSYYETFHLAGRRDRNDEFFTGDLMIRHEPGVRDGLQEFLHDVSVLMQHRTIDELKLLICQGDLVFILAKGTHEGQPCVYVDLYRVENEKIVEHWGFPQAQPPQTESKSNNRML